MLTSLIFCFTFAQNDIKTRFYAKYSQPYEVTKLEWELNNFNMIWHNSFDYTVEYVSSSPASYDYVNQNFYCGMLVHNKRAYNDNEPFLELSSWKQKVILNKVIDHFTKLLRMSFPEVSDNKELILIEFHYDGSTVIAKYENGKLILM